MAHVTSHAASIQARVLLLLQHSACCLEPFSSRDINEACSVFDGEWHKQAQGPILAGRPRPRHFRARCTSSSSIAVMQALVPCKCRKTKQTKPVLQRAGKHAWSWQHACERLQPVRSQHQCCSRTLVVWHIKPRYISGNRPLRAPWPIWTRSRAWRLWQPACRPITTILQR